MLNPYLLAGVTALQTSTYLDSIQILTNEGVSNGQGGVAANWVVTATVHGRLRRVNHRPADQTLMGDKVQPIIHFQFILPLGTLISVRNRILFEGRHYIVRAHDSGRTGALEILVETDPIDGM